MSAHTVFCTRPRKMLPFSWLIMKLQGLKFSHVALCVKDKNLLVRKIYDAHIPYSRVCSLDRFMKVNLVIEAHTVILDDEALRRAEIRALMDLGTPFSWRGILGQLIFYFFGYFPKCLQDGANSAYCCEYLARAFGVKNPETIDLKQFNAWLSKNAKPVPSALITTINNSTR